MRDWQLLLSMIRVSRWHLMLRDVLCIHTDVGMFWYVVFSIFPWRLVVARFRRLFPRRILAYMRRSRLPLRFYISVLLLLLPILLVAPPHFAAFVLFAIGMLMCFRITSYAPPGIPSLPCDLFPLGLYFVLYVFVRIGRCGQRICMRSI